MGDRQRCVVGGASWAEDVFECACAAAATALRALPIDSSSRRSKTPQV